MTAADSLCRSVYADEWERVQAEGQLVREQLRAGESFIRLGDGELEILQRRNYLSKRLHSAIAAASILGLPDSYNRKPHLWRAALLGEIAPHIHRGPVVSATLSNTELKSAFLVSTFSPIAGNFRSLRMNVFW